MPTPHVRVRTTAGIRKARYHDVFHGAYAAYRRGSIEAFVRRHASKALRAPSVNAVGLVQHLSTLVRTQSIARAATGVIPQLCDSLALLRLRLHASARTIQRAALRWMYHPSHVFVRRMFQSFELCE